MHTRPVPVTFYRFWVQFDVVVVLLGQTVQKITGNPDLVTSLLGTFGGDLELPLSGHHLSVQPAVCDTGSQAQVTSAYINGKTYYVPRVFKQKNKDVWVAVVGMSGQATGYI